MAWDEKDVYEHKREQTQAWYRSFIALNVVVLLISASYIFVNRPTTPPEPKQPRMTAEECKTICGDPGVLHFKNEDCECRRPEKTPLRCVCE